MNKFIVFEGVDGSGKTTLAKAFAEETGALYMKTPGNEFSSIREYIDRHAPPESRLLFYLSSVFDASKKASEVLPYQSVVCDRYIWSSLIPHSAYHDKDLDSLREIISPLEDNLLKPDHQFLITVDEQEQLRRLHKNGFQTASDEYCLNNQKRGQVRSLYEQIAMQESWDVIDTTNDDVEDSLRILLESVKGGKVLQC